MCDRKFKFCKNQHTEAEEEKDIDCVDKLSTQKRKKNKKITEETVISNQPNTCHSHVCQFIHEKSILPKPCPCPFDPLNNIETAVNFNNQTSTVNLPPSFNLKSDKKSTPIQLNRKGFETTLNSSPILKHRTNSSKKQNSDEIKVEIHNEDESNETFYTM